MKISNSKKQLAKIISENGGWRDGEFAAQDKDGEVFKFDSKPVMGSSREVWMPTGNGADKLCYCATIKGWHQTILSRAEYFHLYPTPDADGWIEWKGGECPVERGTLVDVKYAEGEENIGVSAMTQGWHEDHVEGTNKQRTAANWVDRLPVTGIVAYRLHKPEQAKPELCESVMRSIPEPESKPTIEQLAADYRNAKDYAERKQQEADDAKSDANAKLKALELAGEAIGLIVSPITAKQESDLVITDWRDLRLGDEIKAVRGNGGSIQLGEIGVITEISNDGFWSKFPSASRYYYYDYHFRDGSVIFIRRP